MKKRCVWEKWKDPLNSNIEETEWPGFDQDEDGGPQTVSSPNISHVMHTPFGMLSMTSNSIAATSFDFWMLHTNFDITSQVRSIIQEVPGVETLEVQTRYRARVGFPKSGLFVSSDTMRSIQMAIANIDRHKQDAKLFGLPVSITDEVISTRNKIDDKYENWLILVLPNGSTEVVATDIIDQDYISKINILKSVNSLVGGRLLTNDNS